MTDQQNQDPEKNQEAERKLTVEQRIEAIAEEIGADAHKLVDEFERWLEKETEGSYKSKAPAPTDGTVDVGEKPTDENTGSAMQSQVDESQKPDPNSAAQNGAAGTSGETGSQ